MLGTRCRLLVGGEMELDPEALGRRSRYALLTDALVPRPIAWVLSCDPEGNGNLAPFSFFGGIAATPPLVGVSIGRRRGTKKDTLRNLETVGEAVVHIPSEELAEKMVLTSGDYPPEVDELSLAGLTPIASRRVRPPRIAEAPLSMECRVEQILDLGDPDAKNGFAILRVVLFHVRDDLLEGDRIRVDRFSPVGRLGGTDYCRTGDRFSIPRPDTEVELERFRRRGGKTGQAGGSGADSLRRREDEP